MHQKYSLHNVPHKCQLFTHHHPSSQPSQESSVTWPWYRQEMPLQLQLSHSLQCTTQQVDLWMYIVYVHIYVSNISWVLIHGLHLCRGHLEQCRWSAWSGIGSFHALSQCTGWWTHVFWIVPFEILSGVLVRKIPFEGWVMQDLECLEA